MPDHSTPRNRAGIQECANLDCDAPFYLKELGVEGKAGVYCSEACRDKAEARIQDAD